MGDSPNIEPELTDQEKAKILDEALGKKTEDKKAETEKAIDEAQEKLKEVLSGITPKKPSEKSQKSNTSLDKKKTDKKGDEK